MHFPPFLPRGCPESRPGGPRAPDHPPRLSAALGALLALLGLACAGPAPAGPGGPCQATSWTRVEVGGVPHWQSSCGELATGIAAGWFHDCLGSEVRIGSACEGAAAFEVAPGERFELVLHPSVELPWIAHGPWALGEPEPRGFQQLPAAAVCPDAELEVLGCDCVDFSRDADGC